ncbi:MAG: CerR family C-terminal domain-containing protein [Desulfobacterales bacterium]|jgi:AcrR family transcriptional regulator
MTSPKERILDAAGRVFGRKGYKAATVREICNMAQVNLAAVNYYFDGKQDLYRSVVRNLFAQAFDQFPLSEGPGSQARPEQQLRAFVSAILLRMLSPGDSPGEIEKGRLLARELGDPSPVLDDIFKEYIRPQVEILQTIIQRLVSRPLTDLELARYVFSIIGQCAYYALAKPIVLKVVALEFRDPAAIEALAGHISRFSIAGIRSAQPQAPEVP